MEEAISSANRNIQDARRALAERYKARAPESDPDASIVLLDRKDMWEDDTWEKKQPKSISSAIIVISSDDDDDDADDDDAAVRILQTRAPPDDAPLRILQTRAPPDDAPLRILQMRAPPLSFSSQSPAISLVEGMKGSLDAIAPDQMTPPIFQTHLRFLEPFPDDIRALFQQYDRLFFRQTLGAVPVAWSKRMTLCAGLCRFQRNSGFCQINLSQPLLQLRTCTETIETLLHEMIHAHVFVTGARDHSRDGHGEVFCKHMHRINACTGLSVSVYHNFKDEVWALRKHHWKCTGPCVGKSPHFGMVKRAMNRAPGPNDHWWAAHQQACGGVFVKVAEPKGYVDKRKKKESKDKTKKKKKKKKKEKKKKRGGAALGGGTRKRSKAASKPRNTPKQSRLPFPTSPTKKEPS